MERLAVRRAPSSADGVQPASGSSPPAMKTAASPKESTMVVMFDNFRPLVKSFFERMTVEQWQLLRAGSPDDATITLLAELLVSIVTSVTNTILTAANIEVIVCEEQIHSSLGDSLSESFAEALCVPDSCCISSEESKLLKDLVVKEVLERVNSALIAENMEEPAIKRLLTPPSRLKVMLQHVLTMLKCTMENLCVPEAKEKKGRSSRGSPQQDTVEELLEERQVSEGAGERSRSADSTASSGRNTVRDIIRIEVENITEPLLENVTDTEYEVLRFQSTQEIVDVAEDVAQLIATEELDSASGSSSASGTARGSTKSLKHKRKMTQKAVGRKIRSFFAKSCARACLLHMVQQQKRRSVDYSTAESRKAMRPLLNSVDALFSTEDEDQEDDQRVDSVFPRLETVLEGKDLVLPRELSEMIIIYTSGEMMPESLQWKSLSSEVALPQTATDTRILNVVAGFLSLMNWWLKNQAGHHVHKVTLALRGEDSSTQRHLLDILSPHRIPMLVPGEPEIYAVEEYVPCNLDEATPNAFEEAVPCDQEEGRTSKEANPPNLGDEELDEEPALEGLEENSTVALSRKEIAIKILVEGIVSRTVKKAKGSCGVVNPAVIMEHLFTKVWSEIRGDEFQITAQTFEDLDKVIFKYLCKKWGNAKTVLWSMSLQDPAVEKSIARFCKECIVTPPRSSGISRFFSSLGKVFKQRNDPNVL